MLCLDEENFLNAQTRLSHTFAISNSNLCLDVVQIICDFCNLKTQINLIRSCKEYDNSLKINSLDCSTGIGAKITQKILQQKKFSRLRYLHVPNNKKITNVNHLKDSLIQLDCRDESGIDQEGIKELRKLQKLNVWSNNKITNVNHLKDTLIELNCGGFIYGINQEGISELRKLQNLNAFGNERITTVNHLKDSLIELDCSGPCGIDQEGIKELRKVQKLNAYENKNITNVNHLCDSLIILDCRFFCGIDQQGIKELQKLQKLYVYGNTKIKNVNHLRESLIELWFCEGCNWHGEYYCDINKEGFNELRKLQILNSRKISASCNRRKMAPPKS